MNRKVHSRSCICQITCGEEQKRTLLPNRPKPALIKGQTLIVIFNILLSVSVERGHVMTEKLLINSVQNCVDESLYGFAKLHANLFVDFSRKIVLDTKCCVSGRIAVLSGGGSGHEPFPAGFVGEGMLAASVSGPVFTSPPSKHVLHGIRMAAARSSGILLVVPNYTGDVLNFGLAAETASAEGIRVESLVVGEDVALEAKGAATKPGKRGMCGLVLTCKIAGYLAQKGLDLATVKRLSAEAARSTASMGLCVSACCKPGVGLLFRLQEDEVEVGVGVHGEAGTARAKMLSAREAVETLLKFVLCSLNVTEGDEVVALLNNLGSLSCMEQWLLAGELEGRLTERKIRVARLYAGCFFTSLNMAGVQICILKLRPETKETFLEALDHPVEASGWVRQTNGRPREECVAAAPPRKENNPSKIMRLAPEETEFFKRSFVKISRELKKQEAHLNHLDSICGDGDCGTTFACMADLIKASADDADFSDPIALLSDLSAAVEAAIGGTTGALYGLFIKGCVGELGKFDNLNDPLVFSKCWRAGVDTIKKYSSAEIGDRTMLDSLETGCQTFETHLNQESTTWKEAFRSAFKAAKEGCEATKFLTAKAGRASYVDQSQQKDVDAGAYAVTVWLSAILQASEEK